MFVLPHTSLTRPSSLLPLTDAAVLSPYQSPVLFTSRYERAADTPFRMFGSPEKIQQHPHPTGYQQAICPATRPHTSISAIEAGFHLPSSITSDTCSLSVVLAHVSWRQGRSNLQTGRKRQQAAEVLWGRLPEQNVWRQQCISPQRRCSSSPGRDGGPHQHGLLQHTEGRRGQRDGREAQRQWQPSRPSSRRDRRNGREEAPG